MGNRNSAIYNDILGEFERNDDLIVIQASAKTEAKVYNKISLNSPCKVVVMCEVKEGEPKILSFNSSFRDVLANFDQTLINQKKIIEYFAGKDGLKNENIFEKISRDLKRIPSFESDGLYKIVHTFQPYIIMEPGSYKVEYYVVTAKNLERKYSIPYSDSLPHPDIYGKI